MSTLTLSKCLPSACYAPVMLLGLRDLGEMGGHFGCASSDFKARTPELLCGTHVPN